MALSAFIIWECRTTGASTNGGGFKSGASGTDWSQQDAAQYSVTDGVTAGTTTITSATANFGTDVVGNIIYVSGGTGSVTAARYEITGRTNSTTITVDRSTGLTAGTGVTLKIGGAVDSPVTINSAVVAGNIIYIKYHASNKYNLASTWTLTGGTVYQTNQPTVWVGYDTTRTVLNEDSNQPTIWSNNNALYPSVQLGAYTILRNVLVDGIGMGVGEAPAQLHRRATLRTGTQPRGTVEASGRVSVNIIIAHHSKSQTNADDEVYSR